MTTSGAWALVAALVAGAGAPVASAADASTATAADDVEAAALAAAPAPRIVIALDAGHGGSNLGARGLAAGVYEKQVTLALAARVRALLLARDHQPTRAPVAVVLCRPGDVLVPIRARARCAREAGARVFVSLHANAVPPGAARGSQRGFEIYLLGPREVEDDAALAALAEPDDADAVFAAHEVRAAAEQSVRLAARVDGRMTAALGAGARRGVRQAGAALDVLRATGAASVLVEVGFLDHPDEGARLATPEGREPIARALADALRDYAADLAARAAPVTTAAPAPAPAPARAPALARRR